MAAHYRMVAPSKRAAVRARARAMMRSYAERHGWDLLSGKMVLEVRPRDSWDKGDAVRWIWRRYAPTALPIYFGDDTTDEDAFRALRRRGVTVRVGQKRGSAAEYVVAQLDDAAPWIDWMLEEFSPT